jgi:hypothetical protein
VRRLVRITGVASVCALGLTACNFTTLTSARWSCGTHKYVINPHGAPKGGVGMVKETFHQLNGASPRVKWAYAGETKANTAQANLVVVAWRSQKDVAAVMRPGAYAASAPQPWPNTKRWTGGIVLIDPAYKPNLGVMLHDVGHIAGLGHVKDPSQVMHPEPRTRTRYAAGDKVGLHMLSKQCK